MVVKRRRPRVTPAVTENSLPGSQEPGEVVKRRRSRRTALPGSQELGEATEFRPPFDEIGTILEAITTVAPKFESSPQPVLSSA